VIGSVDRLVDEAAARQAVSALCVHINAGDARIKENISTVSELAEHYRQRELRPDTVWKTYSTKVTYEGYLNKWILPRWGNYPLLRINAGEVELWLRSLTLARASCAKIRNLMSVHFNHGIRYEICHRNPIQLVRQSAKRKAVPVVLTPMEVQRLLYALAVRERTLVLAVGILKRIGWHTFRHKYSSLLRQNRTDIKVTQELLRHASSRVTLDTYTQAVTLHKRKAQSDVIEAVACIGCGCWPIGIQLQLCLFVPVKKRSKCAKTLVIRYRLSLKPGGSCAFLCLRKLWRLHVSG